MPVIKPLNHKSQVKQYTQADIPFPPSIANRVLALNNVIVGTTGQVNSGIATHTSIQAAHDFVSSGDKITVLEGSFSGDVNISKTVTIIGEGHGSVISGNLFLNSGAIFCAVELLKVTGNISLAVGANGNFVTRCWLATGSTLSDLGSGNYTNVIEE